MTTLKDLQNIQCGDQIIIKDPLLQTKVPYAFICKDDDGALNFISEYRASFMIKDQETIDSFEVELIDSEHPLWDTRLAFAQHFNKAFEAMFGINLYDVT